jgi:hypothetical protein
VQQKQRHEVPGDRNQPQSDAGPQGASTILHRVKHVARPAQFQLSPELQQIVRAAGANPVENPSPGITHYGYANVSAAAPMVAKPNTLSNVEATKTEPDKNTYLRLERQVGPDAGYAYGSRFLFQGHEAGLVVDPPINNVNRQGATPGLTWTRMRRTA